jgi:hypothetical protein
MAEVTVRHELDCSIDDYWNKCVFDAEFNQVLYVQRLHFNSFVLVEQNDLGTLRTKKAKIEPPLTSVPAGVKKVVGDRLSYFEDGTFDRTTGHYKCVIVPSTFSDKTKVEAELWCEPSPSGDAHKCVRFARVKVEVKVFVVGGIVEEKIMQDLRGSYDAEAAFVREWVTGH